ncbi:MAG: hypothetical protein JW795_21060 [Chitinivibrionales bacterium]|nr:hypothetical protein [Chitinivibrionales bacterium]
MLGKLILLPIILIKNVLSLLFSMTRSGLFSFVTLIGFIVGRVFGGVIGALIGLLLGSRNIGIRSPFGFARKRR